MGTIRALRILAEGFGMTNRVNVIPNGARNLSGFQKPSTILNEPLPAGRGPMLKLCPYVLGFQPERTADRHEGE